MVGKRLATSAGMLSQHHAVLINKAQYYHSHRISRWLGLQLVNVLVATRLVEANEHCYIPRFTTWIISVSFNHIHIHVTIHNIDMAHAHMEVIIVL